MGIQQHRLSAVQPFNAGEKVANDSRLMQISQGLAALAESIGSLAGQMGIEGAVGTAIDDTLISTRNEIAFFTTEMARLIGARQAATAGGEVAATNSVALDAMASAERAAIMAAAMLPGLREAALAALEFKVEAEATMILGALGASTATAISQLPVAPIPQKGGNVGGANTLNAQNLAGSLLNAFSGNVGFGGTDFAASQFANQIKTNFNVQDFDSNFKQQIEGFAEDLMKMVDPDQITAELGRFGLENSIEPIEFEQPEFDFEAFGFYETTLNEILADFDSGNFGLESIGLDYEGFDAGARIDFSFESNPEFVGDYSTISFDGGAGAGSISYTGSSAATNATGFSGLSALGSGGTIASGAAALGGTMLRGAMGGGLGGAIGARPPMMGSPMGRMLGAGAAKGAPGMRGAQGARAGMSGARTVGMGRAGAAKAGAGKATTGKAGAAKGVAGKAGARGLGMGRPMAPGALARGTGKAGAGKAATGKAGAAKAGRGTTIKAGAGKLATGNLTGAKGATAKGAALGARGATTTAQAKGATAKAGTTAKAGATAKTGAAGAGRFGLGALAGRRVNDKKKQDEPTVENPHDGSIVDLDEPMITLLTGGRRD